MNRQVFLGIFLIVIGVIGLIVGVVTHHLMDSTAQMIGYFLPIVLGAIMLLIERTSK